MIEIQVVGAAILQKGKVLAAQRSGRMKEAYKWEFAGGKVEPGESHQQALCREIAEELGVHIRVGDFLAEGSYQPEGKLIRLFVYEADILEGIPVAKEHARLEWIDIGEMGGLDWAEPDLPACRKITKKYGMGSELLDQ